MALFNRARHIPRSKGEVAKDVGIKTGEKVVVGVVGFVPIAIAVTILIIILLLVSVVGVLGHASQDSNFAQQTGLDSIFGNAPITTEAPPPAPTGFTPTCDQIDSYLVSLNVDARDITECARKQLLFTTVSTVLSYPRFETLLGDRVLVFVATDDGSTCSGETEFWGCTKSSSKVLLKNFNDPNDRTPWQYVITHELFHVFGLRNQAVISVYRGLNNSFIQKERDCYRISPTSSVIKTYDLDTKNISESFAESGTLYVLGGRNGKGTISNFQSQCPNNYNFWLEAIGEGAPPTTGRGENCTVGNANTCGGKYNISKNPDGLNFGDSSCELTSGGSINRDLIRNEILSQLQGYNKTKDYCRWSCIAYHEGGYNPNSFNGNTPRPKGAWGMFQFLPRACYGPDKPYYYNRTGNVNWKEQIKRALALEYKSLEPNDLDWRYWSTYKWTCSKEPDWSPGKSCLKIGN